MDGGDAERRAELHDGFRPAGPDQRIEEAAGFGGDGHVHVLGGVSLFQSRRVRERPAGQQGRGVAVLGGGGEQAAERGRDLRSGESVGHARILDATLRLGKGPVRWAA